MSYFLIRLVLSCLINPIGDLHGQGGPATRQTGKKREALQGSVGREHAKIFILISSYDKYHFKLKAINKIHKEGKEIPITNILNLILLFHICIYARSPRS